MAPFFNLLLPWKWLESLAYMNWKWVFVSFLMFWQMILVTNRASIAFLMLLGNFIYILVLYFKCCSPNLKRTLKCMYHLDINSKTHVTFLYGIQCMLKTNMAWFKFYSHRFSIPSKIGLILTWWQPSPPRWHHIWNPYLSETFPTNF